MKVDMSPTAIRGRLRAMEQLWLLSVKLMNSNTKKLRPTRAIEIYDSIRQVLLRDWDPIGISGTEGPSDEYDAYIPKVYRVLVGSRCEDGLVDCLARIEGDDLGVEPASSEQLRPVAQKLLQLKVTLN